MIPSKIKDKQFHLIRQLNGTIIEFNLNAVYIRKKDKKPFKLIKVEYGEGPVEGKFLSINENGNEIECWEDLTWNFHIDYKPQDIV